MSSVLRDPASYAEIQRCSLCGAAHAETKLVDPPFRIVTCRSCGLAWVTPRLRSEILPAVYDRDYWRSDSPKDRGYADYVDQEDLYLRTFRRRLEFVEGHVRGPGRLLDVGCAAGFFMKVAQDAGWRVDGVEVSDFAARAAAERYGFDQIHQGDLATAPFEPATFDLITMWDVVEHVPDPLDLVGRARQLLAPEGLLVVETQNIGSRFASVLGHRWHHYKHMEHLYHFCPRTIRLLLEQAGLVVEKITPRHAGKLVSIGFIRERAARVHPLFPRLLRPLRRFDGASLYVNPMDEMIVLARGAGRAASGA